MEPQKIIELKDTINLGLSYTGSKAVNLSILMKEGFKVPPGFCITTSCYKEFVEKNSLYQTIDLEISRKNPSDMRWEEIWDASLRIRSVFLKSEMPEMMVKEILDMVKGYGENVKFSVRSSSPAEDSVKTSFAGIHDSFINVKDPDEIIKAVKLVWASLWTDRSILYREELELDSVKSAMAVVVQKMEKRPVSGLAFSKDPTGASDNLIIEAVEGLLSHLVDNEKKGLKFEISREGKIIQDRPDISILTDDELHHLMSQILKIEDIFGYPVDVEWTGTLNDFIVLQVRPITSLENKDEDREWYLTLTPHFADLQKLSLKVENHLIPELIKVGDSLAAESIKNLSRQELADKLKERAEIYYHWKDIYWDSFIPFAHGIRNLGIYYNDLIKPDNPYEFIELLKGEKLLANSRNQNFIKLSNILKESQLKNEIFEILKSDLKGKELIERLKKIVPDEVGFIDEFLLFLDKQLDVTYQNQSIQDHPEILLRNIWELSKKQKTSVEAPIITSDHYQEKFLKTAGTRVKEAEEVLRIGHLSWKLRDDDNILLGRVENQFLKILNMAGDLLKNEGRLNHDEILVLDDWKIIYKALFEKLPVEISVKRKLDNKIKSGSLKARQLVGQPASPGIVTGRARIIEFLNDFSNFKSGEILIADAIEPQMTFLASMASGIVERRGGMLVHSSIIARELGIPSVNGVSQATELIKNGDIITVNGYLGLVIIGEPEFNLELEKTVRV